MSDSLLETEPEGAVPLHPVSAAGLSEWLSGQPGAARSWLDATGFEAKPCSISLVPGEGGALERVVFGVEETPGPWALAGLPAALPAGDYRLEADWAAPGL